jgi:hypothetical protein
VKVSTSKKWDLKNKNNLKRLGLKKQKRRLELRKKRKNEDSLQRLLTRSIASLRSAEHVGELLDSVAQSGVSPSIKKISLTDSTKRAKLKAVQWERSQESKELLVV